MNKTLKSLTGNQIATITELIIDHGKSRFLEDEYVCIIEILLDELTKRKYSESILDDLMQKINYAPTYMREDGGVYY